MTRSNAGMGVMDRIAIAAVLAVSMLILTMVGFTARSAPLPASATAVVAMATYVELHAVATNQCKSLKACLLGRS